MGSVPWKRATRPIRHASAHALVRIVQFAVRRVSRERAVDTGRFLGMCAALLSRQAVTRSILNVNHVTGGRMERDARACVDVIARRVGENAIDVLRAQAPRWPQVDIDGRAHLDAALAGGRGAVVVSAHHGPWELIPIALAAAGYRVALITRSLRDPEWERWISGMRESAGIRVFPRDTPIAEVIRWTSQGGVLGIALDQRVRGATESATFVGCAAPVVRGPVVIAQRADAPLLACTVRRLAGTTLRATMSPPIAPVHDASGRISRGRTARVLARHLDVLVRRDIAQWVWWHARFSSWPPDADRSTR